MDKKELIFPKNWKEWRRKLQYWKKPEIQENICPVCHCYGGRFKHDGWCQFYGCEIKGKEAIMPDKQTEFDVCGKKVIKYNHHGNDVFVFKDKIGQHREHCLCWVCGKFYCTPENMEKNCVIARLLYNMCVAQKLVTPVWECPDWIPPRDGQLDEREKPCEKDTEYGKAMMPEKGK